jgi:hypothetical protein
LYLMLLNRKEKTWIIEIIKTKILRRK